MYVQREIRCNSLAKYFIAIMLGLCFVASTVNAQSAKYFEKIIPSPYPYFEDGWHVNTIPDGYIIGCGRAIAPSDIQAFAIKTDLSGNLIWEFSIQDTSVNNGFLSGCVVDSCFVFAGYNWNPITGKNRTLICKVDSSGNQIWQKLIGDSILSNFIRSIDKTDDGGFILSGHVLINSYEEGYIIKTDSGGTVEWTSQYNGPLNDELRSIKYLTDGSSISTGYTNFASGSSSIRLVRIDSLGFVQLDTFYIFPNNYSQLGMSVINAMNGDYIIGGVSGGSLYQGLIFRIDSNGNMIWSKLITEFSNGTGSMYSSAIRSVYELPDSSIVCTGDILLYTGLQPPYNQRLLILKLDKFGNELWRRIYTPLISGDTYGISLDLAHDGGFIISGRTESPNNADVYLLKTNCLGFIAGPQANFNYLVNGTIATFYNLSQNSDTCIYYFGDGDSTFITHVDTIPVAHNYPSTGWFNPYMVAYACGETDTTFMPLYSGVNNESEFMSNSFNIYPNPGSDFVNISYLLPHSKTAVDLLCFDISGRLLKSITLDSNAKNFSLDVSSFEQGSYILFLKPEGYQGVAKKLIVLKK